MDAAAPSPAESLTIARRSEAPGPDLRRRITYLMLLRTIVISLVLGLALWMSWAKSVDPYGAASLLLLLGVVGTTYALTIVYAVLLRGGIAPERLIWPQIVGDLAVTTLLVHVTGGAQSAYTFFFALSIVGAAMVRSRRETVVVTLVSMALLFLAALSVWQQVLPVPVLPTLTPEAQSTGDFLRSLGLNLGALLGVGALAYLLAGELQRTEASLATERRVVADLVTLHQDIVRSLTSGLVTVDLDGRILTVNSAAAELLGDSQAGRDIEEVLPGLRVRLADLEPGGELRRFDLAIAGAERPVVLGISVSPLRDVHDRLIGRVINFTDLSELRRMEQQYKQAERMSTIGQLAAGIAHEIRNPLASMSGSIELLQQAAEVSEDDRTLMQIVVREIDRLNALINDLLDYANPRPRESARFDLSVMIEETVTVFRQDKSRGDVDVQTILPPPGALIVDADPAKLRQVVWNLVRNAADAATVGGGHVVVSVSEERDRVEIVITDDGPGISPEHLPRIFDPFFTTKKKGTGLGLATCLSVVTEHGGELDVESEPGKGTRFVIRLARTAPAGEQETKVPVVSSAS
jgi:two-component system, NtrC family, sensor histidine kinase PilS